MARTAPDQVRSEDMFPTALFGYSMDEVDAYVEDTARRMRRLAAEIQRLAVAETQLGAARIEISKLTSELAEARPLSSVGPRVQAILRMAEREAESLRRTAFEVLRKAYEEARAVRQQAQDEAYAARRDYQVALHERRQRDLAVLAEQGPTAALEVDPEDQLVHFDFVQPEPVAVHAGGTVPPAEADAAPEADERVEPAADQHVEPAAPAADQHGAPAAGAEHEPEADERVEPVAGADHVVVADVRAEPVVGAAPSAHPVAVTQDSADQDDAPEAAAPAVAVEAAAADVADQVVPAEDGLPPVEGPMPLHTGNGKRRKRNRNQHGGAGQQPVAAPNGAKNVPAKRG